MDHLLSGVTLSKDSELLVDLDVFHQDYPVKVHWNHSELGSG